MEPIIVSLAFYGCVIIFCELSRQLVDQVTQPNTETRKFFYEVIATTQVCTCVYENSLVTKYYGIFPGFFFAVFTLLVAHSFMNRGALVTPCNSVERFVFRKLDIVSFLVYFCAELLGGYLAFRVPMIAACAYEVFGTFVIRSAVGRAPLKYKRYVTAVSIATMLSLAAKFVGPPGLNPIISASRILGCKGLSTQGHLFVYWVCPITGWLMAAKLQDYQEKSMQKKIE